MPTPKSFFKNFLLLAILVTGLLSTMPASLSLAVCPVNDPVCANGGTIPSSSADACANTTGSGGGVDPAKVQSCVNQSPFVQDIQKVVNFLSAAVGVIVIGAIILGGIQYIIAGDNPNALTAARQRITNGLIALVAFLFIFAFLQWLIPGGLFSNP